MPANTSGKTPQPSTVAREAESDGIDTAQMISVLDANGDLIAYVPLSLGRERATAQARLIAGAPRLLETIRKAELALGNERSPSSIIDFRAACRQAAAQLGPGSGTR